VTTQTRINPRQMTEAQHVDATIAERMRCPKCGGPMRYEGYRNGRSYVALAVCCQCYHEVEF